MSSVGLEGGELLADRYEVAGEAGAGGFARAFEATDITSGETVALKVPNYEGSSNDADVIEEYFLKEASALETIESVGGHPNVMSLLDRFEHDGKPVLVVEFVDGFELDEAIEKMGPREDFTEVREIGIALADAMSFLHENEIVYRDLKPDNVMLTRRDGVVTPVLIDFNTATGFDASGSAADSGTTILGPYKPREVAEASRSEVRQGPWSDVYSVGKILLFLLRGTVPKKDGVDPRDFGVDCPAYLAEIVAKATRMEFDDRYPNATALKYVLEARDPSPPPQARLADVHSDRRYTIHPGDTLGRRDAVGPSPSIAIEDAEEYVSTVQVQFETDDLGNWLLRDRSLNGTYVQSGSGWQRVLGAAGRERLREQGEDPTDRNGTVPPTTYQLSGGDLVALVHPSYGVAFEFEDH